MKWVSVLDRLPEKNGDYYLKGKGNYKLVATYYVDEGWLFYNDVAVNKVDSEYLYWLDENE